MKGDRIICRTCGRVSTTIEIIGDSRIDNTIQHQCPYCHGTLTTNVEGIVEVARKRGWYYVLTSKKIQRQWGGRVWDVYLHLPAIRQYPRNRKSLNSNKDKINSEA